MQSTYPGGTLKCTAKTSPATDWGTYPDSSYFPPGGRRAENDAGWGQGTDLTVVGDNILTLHLSALVRRSRCRPSCTAFQTATSS